MNIAEMWDICIEFKYNKKAFAKSLDKFLKTHNVKTILDCGGGTGFPAIELKKLGWDITYCDGNKLMMKRFQEKVKKLQLQIPQFFSNWLDLSKNTTKKFDAVLCRGNSLIYLDSWDKKQVPKNAEEKIKKVLKEFYAILNPNGLLYVDIVDKKAFGSQNYSATQELGEKIINGKKIKLVWKISHSDKKKIRTWKTILETNGKKQEFTYYSYLLKPEELIKLLKETGFHRVEETKIKGENNYTVFIAYK
jgi:SAM-dependent methyltransferase